MCRLLAYLGAPIVMDTLLYQPKNSLINQSISAKELEEPLNGDGFGVGWYVSDTNYEPVTFVSVYPAWNNRNLRNLAPRVRTECLIAHVRAASVGDVSESNCHPFQYRNILMMHNGGIEEFGKVKRKLRDNLTDDLYNWIKGQTDSEHIFALLLNNIHRQSDEITIEIVTQAFEQTFSQIKTMMKEAGITEPAYLNMAFTNGRFIVATRYVTDPRETPLTLYHSTGGSYLCQDGVCQMVDRNKKQEAVLVVSEKLTDIKEDWFEVPKNNFVVVKEDLSIHLKPINA